ncbi:hypothetical protein DSECCO2_450640 [anaerobic digester metagenome]
MKTILTIILILFGLNGISQDWSTKLIGTFEKNYVGTYTKVIFKSDTTFDFYKSWDIISYQLHGKYEIKNDTLILNSENDFITADDKLFFLKNEKWIIVNENKIRTGTDFNPMTVYVGGFLERKNE